MIGRIKTLKGEAAYSELTAYLSEENLAKLETGMAALPAALPASQDLADDILQGKWKQLFNASNPHRDHFPLQALRCLREGLIDNMTFCTSQMFFNIFTHPDHAQTDIRVVSVFTQAGRSAQAKKMIDATMRLYSSTKRKYWEQQKSERDELFSGSLLTKIENKNSLIHLFAGLLVNNNSYDTSAWDDPSKSALMYWEEKDEIRFYHMLKSLPVAEQQFLILPDPHFDGKKFISEEHTTIMHSINLRLNFNVFGRFMLGGKPVCMIPSRGMMQANIEAVYPDTASRAVYRLAISPVSGLYETMKADGRDMYQSFRPLQHDAPEILDGRRVLASYVEGELHDFYHQSIAANIPTQDVKLMCEFTDALYRFAATNTVCKPYADRFAELIIDMEHNAYRKSTIKMQEIDIQKSCDRAFQFWSAIDGSDPVRLPSFKEENANEDEQRRILVALFVKFLMEKNHEFERKFRFSVDTLLDYKTDSKYPFLILAKSEYKKALKAEYEQLTFEQLIMAIAASNHPRDKIVMEVFNEKIDGNLNEAIIFAYESEIGKSLDRIPEYVCVNFIKFINDGQLAKLKCTQPEYFEMLRQTIRNSRYAEQYLEQAVQLYDISPLAFEMLYEKEKINRVFGTIGAALIYHAVKSMNVELLMRLTSDGANVLRIAGSEKPSAMLQAIELDRKDIQVLLMLTYSLGPDWMQIMLASVKRIRRLASYYNDKNEYQLLANDREWVSKIVAQIPAGMLQALDAEKQLPQPRKSIFTTVSSGNLEAIISSFFRNN